MTREEAITVMQLYKDELEHRIAIAKIDYDPGAIDLYSIQLDAFDVAIEALSDDAVQGEWIGYNADKEDWLRTDGTPIFLVCDKCHGTVINNGSAHWNYCPNCGARMKGGDDE